jgi:LAO/AO transport system kinase
MEAIDKHWEYLNQGKNFEIRKKTSIRTEIISLINQYIITSLQKNNDKTNLIQDMVEKVYDKRLDPYSAAVEIFQSVSEINKK